MNDTDDRRKHPRIFIKAYGFNCVCVIRKGSATWKANLVDLSPGGARLVMEGAHGLAEKDAVVFSTSSLPTAEGVLTNLASEVRWAQAQQLGIKFQKELPLGVRDLQDLLSSCSL